MNTVIAVVWPFLLDGHIRLQFVLGAKITVTRMAWPRRAHPRLPFPHSALCGTGGRQRGGRLLERSLNGALTIVIGVYLNA
jgi:hypothetical protein